MYINWLSTLLWFFYDIVFIIKKHLTGVACTITMEAESYITAGININEMHFQVVYIISDIKMSASSKYYDKVYASCAECRD